MERPMISKQFHAGYLLPGMKRLLSQVFDKDTQRVDSFLQRCCQFHIQSVTPLDARLAKNDALLAVASNLVSRGLPTLTPTCISEELSTAFPQLASACTSDAGYDAASWNSAVLESLRSASCMIDQRIGSAEALQRFKETNLTSLLKRVLPLLQARMGPSVLQLLEADADALLFPFPFDVNGIRGLRFIAATSSDGDVVRKHDWVVIPLGGDAAAIKNIWSEAMKLAAPAIRLLTSARTTPAWAIPEGLAALQFLYTPIGAARIHKSLIECVLAGVLDLQAEEWTITVLECDVPCARLGLDDFRSSLTAMFVLEGKSRNLPRVNLNVLTTPEFQSCELHNRDRSNLSVFEPSNPVPPADIFIDIAMLRMDALKESETIVDAKHVLRIRSSRLPQQRRFHLPSAIRYPGLGSTEGGVWKADGSMKEAATTLLRNVFGVSHFRTGQLELLDRLLRGTNVVAAMPPGSGKTLPCLLAGLLQPACSLLCVPTSLLCVDHTRTLVAYGIDAAVAIHDAQGSGVRKAGIRCMSAGEAVFIIMTAESFATDEVRSAFGEMKNSGIAFSRAIVDEAHSMSEWSHDLRFAMHHLPSRMLSTIEAPPFKRIPVTALTAVMSRRVIEHIRMQIDYAGTRNKEESCSVLIEYGVLPPSCLLIGHAEPTLTGSAHSETDIDTLVNILEAVPSTLLEAQSHVDTEHRFTSPQIPDFLRGGTQYAGMVFCRDLAGTKGVSVHFSAGEQAGVAEKLSDAGFAVARCTGEDNDTSRVGRRVGIEALEQYESFRTAQSTLLVTTRAAGIGMNRPAVRCTVHLAPPPSVQHLLQECSRAGRDGKPAVNIVLSTGAAFENNEDFDEALLRKLLLQEWSSAAREKQILHDMLREITYPEDTNTGRIANLITDEYGIDVVAQYRQRGLDERLVILQRGGTTLGFIDLVTQQIRVDESFSDADFAAAALGFAYDECLAEAGSPAGLSAWVAATFPSDVDDGIARQLSDFDPGAEFTLRIGFENDREPLLNRIHSLLWRQADIQVQRKLLSEIAADTWGGFREEIETRAGTPGMFASLDSELEHSLQQLFRKLRGRRDTERAITRFEALGVVRDVVAHPSSRKYSLTMITRRDAEILSSVESYLGMLMPRNHVEHAMQSLRSTEADSLLERALYFLVDCLYRWQSDRANVEVADLREAYRVGFNSGISRSFREFCEFTLLARQARSDGVLQVLDDRRDRRLTGMLDIIEVLEAEGPAGIFERVHHLRRSVQLLDVANGSHPDFDCLRYASDMILPEQTPARESTQERLVDAFLLTAVVSDATLDAYRSAVERFANLMRRYVAADTVTSLQKALLEAENRLDTLRASHSVQTLTSKIPSTAPATADRTTPRTPKAVPRRSAPDSSDEGMQRSVVTSTKQRAPTAERQSASSVVESAPPSTEKTVSREHAPESPPSAAEETLHPKLGEHATASAPPAQQLPRTPSESTSQSEERGAPDTAHAPVAKHKPKAEAVPKSKPESTEAPDPMLLHHLAWLQAFNNRFLHTYESRNHRVSSDA